MDIDYNKKDNYIMKHEFRSIVIDTENKTFEILDGTKGSYNIADIKECEVLNEHAKFRGETKPFFHQIVEGSTVIGLFQPKMYAGLKIEMKNGMILGVYVSSEPVLMQTDQQREDHKEAIKIKKILEKYK